MTGRTIVWVIVGLLLGVRAAVRARSTIVSLRREGEVFGEAHVGESPLVLPVASLLGGGLCLALAVRFEGNLTVLAHVVFVSACLYLALVDIDTHVLPRRATYAALSLGVPLLVIASLVDDEGTLLGAVFGAFGAWILLRVFAVLSRGDLGGGDVTLALLLGTYTGFRSLWDVAYGIAAGFAVGGVFALVLLLTRRADRRTRFAFGPFLIVGALLVVVR